MTDKAALRLELKERRFALSLGERREKGCAVTAFAEEVLFGYHRVLAYAAKDPEVETLVLINRLLAAGKTVAVPIIEKETRTLRLSKLLSVRDLEPSTFNARSRCQRKFRYHLRKWNVCYCRFWDLTVRGIESVTEQDITTASFCRIRI